MYKFHLEIRILESRGSRAEAQNQRFLKSSVKFLNFVMIWVYMASAFLCGGWSTAFYQIQSQCSVYQEISEHSMLVSADKHYGDNGSFSQQDLESAKDPSYLERE